MRSRAFFRSPAGFSREFHARGEHIGGSIPAIIFPADTPQWQINLAEADENLCRKELNAEERAAHTVIRLAALKASGQCASLKERAAAVGRTGGRGNKSERVGPAVPTLSPPTVIQATAEAIGVTEDAVKKRVRSVGRAVGKTVNVEETSADELDAIGRDALAKAQETRSAAAKKGAAATTKAKKAKKEADQAFGAWWDAQGFGLNHQTRAALVKMGQDMEAARACFATTERRSIEQVYLNDFSRFTDARKPPESTPAEPPKKRGKPKGEKGEARMVAPGDACR